jgi:tripartite-type tricarboxylate transporter receptor subunit TctC
MTFTQQWYSAGVSISGATGTTYTTQASDIGNTITVEEIPTGGGSTGAGATQTSAATGTIMAATTNSPSTLQSGMLMSGVFGSSLTGNN